ncbi:hypothetical protein Trydic_g22943 [Trypoxylus dichotomus]
MQHLKSLFRCRDAADDSELECVTDQNKRLSKDIDKISHVGARILNRGLGWAEQINADIEDTHNQSLQRLREQTTDNVSVKQNWITFLRDINYTSEIYKRSP